MYKIIRIPHTDSTNTYLKDLVTDEAVCVIADCQTGGRGRRGRTFESPEGGLYMSFTAPTSLFGDALTARAAVAVARAVERISGICVRIKWVNDIYANERKLCGILAEGVWSKGILRSAVVGIGINLLGELPESIRDIATTVSAEGGRVPEKEELASAILEEFERCDDFYEEYKKRQLLLGCDVTVYRGDESFDAAFEDIDKDCAVILRLEDGRRMALSSGEISLRRRENDK